MKDYDKNKESSYIKFWDIDNFCEWTMSQKIPVNNFQWIKDYSKFNEDLIKTYNEESDVGYFLDVDVQYFKTLHKLHNDWSFLSERMKIEKVEKLAANVYDKTKCVIHIRNLKQTLNYGLVLKKVHRVIIFNQNAWLKPYIDMNTDLRKKAKNGFDFFFKLMNNAVFGKIIENVRKHFIVYIIAVDIYKKYHRRH